MIFFTSANISPCEEDSYDIRPEVKVYGNMLLHFVYTYRYIGSPEVIYNSIY